MDIRIDVEDMATPFLKELASKNRKWMASALKSAAYHSQKAIKEGIRSQSPGGQPYEKHALDDFDRARLEYALSGQSRKKYPIMGQLRRAVGYDSKNANNGVVTVGWLSRSSAQLGGKQQSGYTIPFTDRMRKAFMAAGFHPSKSKTTITVTARQTMAPMLPKVQQIAIKTMEEKLISYIKGNQERSSKTSKRTYKVYK